MTRISAAALLNVVEEAIELAKTDLACHLRGFLPKHSISKLNPRLFPVAALVST
jgi:hypothetical protein